MITVELHRVCVVLRRDTRPLGALVCSRSGYTSRAIVSGGYKVHAGGLRSGFLQSMDEVSPSDVNMYEFPRADLLHVEMLQRSCPIRRRTNKSITRLRRKRGPASKRLQHEINEQKD